MNTIFSDLLKEKIDNGEGSKIGWHFQPIYLQADSRWKRLDFGVMSYGGDLFEENFSFSQIYELILKKKIELLNNYDNLKKSKYYLIRHERDEKDKNNNVIYTEYYRYMTIDQLISFIAAYELGLHPFVLPPKFDENKIKEFFEKNDIEDTDLVLVSSGVTGKNQLKKVSIDSLFRDSKLDKYLKNQKIYVNSYLFYVTGILYNVISPLKNNSISYIVNNSSIDVLSACNFALLTSEDVSSYYSKGIRVERSDIKRLYLVGSSVTDKTIEKIHKIFPNLSENTILFAYASTENGIISLVEEKDFRYHDFNGIKLLSCGSVDTNRISISENNEICINGKPTGDYGKLIDNNLFVLGKNNKEINLELMLFKEYGCECIVYEDNNETIPVFELSSIDPNKKIYQIYKSIIADYPNALFLYRFMRHATMKKIIKKENIEFCQKNKTKCSFLVVLKELLREDLHRNEKDNYGGLIDSFCDIENHRSMDFELEQIIYNEISLFDDGYEENMKNVFSDVEIKKWIIDYLHFVYHNLTLTPKNTMFFIKLSRDRVNDANSMRNDLYEYKYAVKLNVMQTLKQVFGTEDIEEVINIIENEFKVEDELNNSK